MQRTARAADSKYPARFPERGPVRDKVLWRAPVARYCHAVKGTLAGADQPERQTMQVDPWPSIQDFRTRILGDADCVEAVLRAYSETSRAPERERAAFNEAVRAWRRHNPTALPEHAEPAVTTIIAHKAW